MGNTGFGTPAHTSAKESSVLPSRSPPILDPNRPDSIDSRTEDTGEQVPVMFRWTGGGQRVYLTGSFTDWSRQGIPMVRSGQEFYQIVNLPRGVHEFKFVVDDEWKHSQDLPVVQDSQGIVNNVIDTVNYRPYIPSPSVDPLDAAEIDDFAVDVQDAPSNEPPTIPALLLKAGLIAAPLVKDLSCSSVLLNPYLVGERNKPLIPGHALCMHIFEDERGDCSVVNLRYRQKISTHLILSSSSSFSGGGSLRTLLQQRSRTSADLSTFTD
jgi:hypothetical protein